MLAPARQRAQRADSAERSRAGAYKGARRAPRGPGPASGARPPARRQGAAPRASLPCQAAGHTEFWASVPVPVSPRLGQAPETIGNLGTSERLGSHRRTERSASAAAPRSSGTGSHPARPRHAPRSHDPTGPATAGARRAVSPGAAASPPAAAPGCPSARTPRAALGRRRLELSPARAAGEALRCAASSAARLASAAPALAAARRPRLRPRALRRLPLDADRPGPAPERCAVSYWLTSWPGPAHPPGARARAPAERDSQAEAGGRREASACGLRGGQGPRPAPCAFGGARSPPESRDL
uniref:skin secretory protein xP2-like n=1 Tax=Jaculus jaculus TaxID=51337 RepID=UPI001E1B533B|nr:skin secretory protein xP2-like [Jaculus jaculus]